MHGKIFLNAHAPPPILLRTHTYTHSLHLPSSCAYTHTHTHFTLHPNAAQMQTWVDDYFYKAIDEVLSMEPIVETTMVGTVMCGLSQCGEAKSKGEFVMGIIKGLGGNLNIEQRCSFAKKVCFVCFVGF